MQVFFFLFSGFLVKWNAVPIWWRWATYLSPQSYAYSIMIINEFKGLVFECEADGLLGARHTFVVGCCRAAEGLRGQGGIGRIKEN